MDVPFSTCRRRRHAFGRSIESSTFLKKSDKSTLKVLYCSASSIGSCKRADIEEKDLTKRYIE